MTIRVRFKQCLSLQDRLSAWADQARKQASTLPAGSERDRFLKKVRQAETAAHVDEWASSPDYSRRSSSTHEGHAGEAK